MAKQTCTYTGASLGQHYNAMVAPFSMTSTRAVLWALDNATGLSGAAEACLFRAMINGMRDAQPTGDYSFIFAQSESASSSSALALAAALPRASPKLDSRVKTAFPDDGQVVDTTDVAVPDLAISASSTGARSAALGERMALALIHTAFAKQPRSRYAGPLLAGATVVSAAARGSSSYSNDAHDAAIVVALHFESVLPGRLQLIASADCTTCCGKSGAGLDVRITSAADLSARNTASLRASEVHVAPNGSSLLASFAGSANVSNYTVAMLVGGTECVLRGTASNISAVAVAVVLENNSSANLNDGEGEPALRHMDTGRPLFPAPPLGWNAWDAFHCDVSERLVVATADAMVASGMSAAGYRYINLDDGWAGSRASDGSIMPDPARFPSGMKMLANYIHSKGLYFGIYQAPSPSTPQGRPGMAGHETQDVRTFCDWGVDYIKLDARGSSRKVWERVRAAMNKCPRPMYLQVAFCKSVKSCAGWMEDLANAWRTAQDGQANWQSIMQSVDATEPLWPLAGPTGPIGGHWNDADMIEAGNVGLSPEEARTQVALWAMMNMPMLLSNDLREMLLPRNNATLALLTNRGLIALNQDPLGYQARRLDMNIVTAPEKGIAVVTCDGGDEQRWTLTTTAGSGAVRIFHRSSQYALTVPDCKSVSTKGQGVPLTLEHVDKTATNTSCNGKNRLWMLETNGTITSLLDGHCMHRSSTGSLAVESRLCVDGENNTATTPLSERWSVRGAGHNTTIRWGSPHFASCLVPVVIPASGGKEVWEKQLAGGDVALLLLNRNDINHLTIDVNFSLVPGLNSSSTRVSVIRAAVQDVFTGEMQGVAVGGIAREVPPHGVVVLRLRRIKEDELTHKDGRTAVDYDVVVYGSSPAGIAAATAAGMQGLHVALYEPLSMIGGMGAAGNLGLNDGGLKAERTGLAYNFSRRNGEHYYPGEGKECPHAESFVSEASFYSMLFDANVTTIKTDCRVLSAVANAAIESVTLKCEPTPITATVWIDASYDGDVMVAAKNIPYTSGRESKLQYNESFAGARLPSWHGVKKGARLVDAIGPDGNIIKYVQNLTELAPPGMADNALMAFQHRLCITTNTSNQIPWAEKKPRNYVADDFLILLRSAKANENVSEFSLGNQLPGLPPSINKLCTCCGISVDASDQPNLNKGWANASWETKLKIIADHTYFEMGAYFFLSHDPRVPESIRQKYIKYGLCKDEFAANGGIPFQLYVRISNRLVGDYVMTKNNMYPQAKGNVSIAVGAWSLDEHMTGKYAVPTNDSTIKSGFKIMLEGNFRASIGPRGNWYDTPFAIMVPKRGVGENLLVPVAVSTSAVAFSSARIENWYMSVGSAAGVAALQLIDGTARTVHDINVDKVRATLVRDFGQRVNGPPRQGPPALHPSYYNVSGAGDATWNGHYRRSKRKFDEKCIYTCTNCEHCPYDKPCQLYYARNATPPGWRLASMREKIFYTVKHDIGGDPPLNASEWQTASGAAPPPSLLAGPVSSEDHS